jgi:hypothetical protein
MTRLWLVPRLNQSRLHFGRTAPSIRPPEDGPLSICTNELGSHYLPLADSGPTYRLQVRCSARPGCGIMGAQVRAGPGGAGRPLRRLADCKVTCRGIR